MSFDVQELRSFPVLTSPRSTYERRPSSPDFISNDMSASGWYATGSLIFNFSGPMTAIGAYVADGAPLGGFSIELFDGSGSLGNISVGARTLPDSFIGIVRTLSFTSAKFYAESGGRLVGAGQLGGCGRAGTWNLRVVACRAGTDRRSRAPAQALVRFNFAPAPRAARRRCGCPP